MRKLVSISRHKHGDQLWWHFRIGKLKLHRQGHQTDMGVKYWTEVSYNGICYAKIARYV